MKVLKCPSCGKEGPPPEDRPENEPVTFIETKCSDCVVAELNPPKESE